MVQVLMDQGKMKFSEKIVKESVNVIIWAEFVGGSSLRRSKSLTIFFEDEPTGADNVTIHTPTPKLIMEVPTHFPYKEDKMVPWNLHLAIKNDNDRKLTKE